MDASIEMLQCSVARAEIAIPRSQVARIVEYTVAPLPAAAQYVGGLGLIDGRLAVSVALTPALGRARRRALGVLLAAAGALPWIVEVTAIGGFARAVPAGDDEARSPGWIRRVQIGGRALLALEVDAMIARLAGSAP